MASVVLSSLDLQNMASVVSSSLVLQNLASVVLSSLDLQNVASVVLSSLVLQNVASVVSSSLVVQNMASVVLSSLVLQNVARVVLSRLTIWKREKFPNRNLNANVNQALEVNTNVSSADNALNRNHSRFQVLLGVLNITGESPTKQYIKVQSIVLHENYQGDGTSADMALMLLEIPATINENVQLIPMPFQDQEYPEGALCWLTGWGDVNEDVRLEEPKTLQQVQIPLINNSECNKMFHAKIKASPSHVFVKDDMICAGLREGGKDGCQGDSGGPLVCQLDDGKPKLCGLMSWGYGCAREMRPGVYTKICSFIDWINKNTGQPKVEEQKIEKTPVNASPLSTQKTNLTSQVFNSTKETDQDATSAGSRLQIPLSLAVVVVVLPNILVFV
ncbi:prostasin-like [Leptodactylus fuscus]|uniref:prostasin-like n=1 Tax=Leptodactylus fuscus TaxID=238119 RepID=UPI003F4ECEBF